MVSALKFRPHQVEKPWGRTEIPPVFGSTDGKRIGEIWFEPPCGACRAARQVYFHQREAVDPGAPSSAETLAAGLGARARSECWLILDADPGATLGIGLQPVCVLRPASPAAADGTIEELVDWTAVAPGDFFYIPAGTVHAIGAGISLIEVQQNSRHHLSALRLWPPA